MLKPKLSIILPVYNTERYLDKCLNSIYNNTFKDYELIVINDGTKDNSENIILKYKEVFKDRMIYISKENSGLSDTRNLGIKKAQGDYIAFIDSDDYIELDMYEKMFNKLDEYDYDVVVCDVNLVYDNSNKVNTISSGYDMSLVDANLIKQSMIRQYPAVWNKIYKTSIVKKHLFTKNVWYEDMEFTLNIYPDINSIGVVHVPLYNYLQRENSITYTYNDKLYDIISNMTRVVEHYNESGLMDKYKSELEYLYARYAFATFPKRLAKCKDKEKYSKGIDYAIQCVNKYFPNYTKNKYLKQVGLKGYYIKHFNHFLADMNFKLQQNSKSN